MTYTPTEVKAAVTGDGRAEKAQVGAMVARILRLDSAPKPADAADALALAVTDVWRGTCIGAAAIGDGGSAMITSVRGVCLSRDTEHAVVVEGGIGLLLTAPLRRWRGCRSVPRGGWPPHW